MSASIRSRNERRCGSSPSLASSTRTSNSLLIACGHPSVDTGTGLGAFRTGREARFPGAAGFVVRATTRIGLRLEPPRPFLTATFRTAAFPATFRLAGARFVATFLAVVRLVADLPPDAFRTAVPRLTAFFAAVLFVTLLREAVFFVAFFVAFFTALLLVAARLVAPFFAATFFTALPAFLLLERETALRALVRFAFTATPRAGARRPVFFVAFAMVLSWL